MCAEKKKWTKDQIRDRLMFDDRWILRGLMVIYSLQTESEKSSEAVFSSNNVGFTIHDGRILTSFGKQYKSKKWLSSKQMELLREKMPKYARQLADVANGKIVVNVNV